MKPFLYETADDIIKNIRNSLPDCCLIFPNKRTKYYFRKYYAQIIGKTSRPPKMTEIGTLIRELTDFEDAEKLSLIFELFKVFKKFNTSYTFDNFYRLGEIILSDFNEIDAWLVDPKQIYKNIKNLKEIDSHFDWLTPEQKELLSNFWKNFLTEKSSKEKEMFLGLWNLLPEVYTAFTNRLKENKIAYNGLIYRVLSEIIENDSVEINDCKKIIFIGFNALNKAELKFFDYFKKQGTAQFYWDIDAYYYNDEKQEAGDFLRKNFKDLQTEPEKIPENLKEKKHIDIIGTSLNLNQAKLLRSVLKKYENPNETAIVTADESMLFPILSALPESVDSVNVTMGYSFKLTPLYNFIFQFFKMHLFAEKHKSKKLYYKNVLHLLKHAYVKEYNSDLSEKIRNFIEEQRLIYINPEQLPEIENKLPKLLFLPNNSDDKTQTLLTDLLNILSLFFDKNKLESSTETNSLKNEYIFRAYKKIKRFREILLENNEKISLKLASEILLQILKTDTIPFEGESTEGLQIMGLMESRNLDFKNIVILGMNEGNLPKISGSPTFISQSLRFAFGLPVIKHQDAVYAYFFYRLLQRSENITLIYNDLVSDSNSGEMSRFILQLLYESNFTISHSHYNDEIFIRNKQQIEIKKDDNVLEQLDKYIIKSGNEQKNKEFSASSLNTYLTCSLKFYFKYIAEIKEPKKPEDDFTPAEFGSILHTALELIYNDISAENNGNLISKEDIQSVFKKIDDYVSAAFTENFKNNKNFVQEGIMLIIKEVLINYTKSILKYDEKYAPFKIISLEKEMLYNTLLNVKINSKSEQVKLFGIIDRIDEKNGIYRIIDYKTGTIPKGLLSVQNLFDSEYKNRNSHAFQALYYTLIISDMQEFVSKKIKPSLYYVRSINQPDFSDQLIINESRNKINIDENITQLILPDFKENLIQLIEEIFDKNEPFKMTKNQKNCEYCEFNKLCY